MQVETFLAILCEGYVEMDFVEQVLAPHLAGRGRLDYRSYAVAAHILTPGLHALNTLETASNAARTHTGSLRPADDARAASEVQREAGFGPLVTLPCLPTFIETDGGGLLADPSFPPLRAGEGFAADRSSCSSSPTFSGAACCASRLAPKPCRLMTPRTTITGESRTVAMQRSIERS